MRATTTILLVVILLGGVAKAQRPKNSDLKLDRRSISVDGLEREYLIHTPQDVSQPVPVVFGFHGHGGNAYNAARTFHLEKLWPEAVVIYMQGIPTPGKLTDPEGKRNGWQHSPGAQDDRDLRFFDEVLKAVKNELPVDQRRVYSTGHSNGGGFTYLLWSERANILAAVAPSAAGAGKYRSTLTPKPVMHIAGEKDTLVKYRWQELTMEGLKRLNKCNSEGKKLGKYTTFFESEIGTPVVTLIHPGTHKYPRDEAPPAIIQFFKQYQLPEAKAAQE